MGFFSLNFLCGILCAGPVDRTDFPLVVETDYEAHTSIADGVERYDLVEPTRVLVSNYAYSNGVSGDTSYTTWHLNPDGTIKGTCMDKGCDFRQEGREYQYANGAVTRTIRWRAGKAIDSLDFTQADGHVTGATAPDGSVTLLWSGDRIKRVRNVSSNIVYMANFTYSPAGDSIRAVINNSIGDPRDAVRIFALQSGRPVSRVEYEGTSTLFSRTTYRYGVATALPASRSIRARSVPSGIPSGVFDPLGRALSRPTSVPVFQGRPQAARPKAAANGNE